MSNKAVFSPLLLKLLKALGIVCLISLALVGWVVLFVQNPIVLFQARLRYLSAKREGADFALGPCLGKLNSDWVLDISHLPRELIDNDPANQCDELRQGVVTHFVEMTPKGEIIRVK